MVNFRNKKVLVTGAGGFIGYHLVRFLKDQGYWVRGVDIKLPEFGETHADEFELLDLRKWPNCLQATRDVEDVYALAKTMVVYKDGCVQNIRPVLRSVKGGRAA